MRTKPAGSSGLLRHSSADATFVALSACYAALVVLAPSVPLFALGIWWTANTISHNFIHLPFFGSRVLNRGYSIFLSALLGVPQTVWRDRHLAHHADRVWRPRWSRQLLLELVAVAGLWSWMLLRGPGVFFGAWLPGWCLAMLLCQLQGYFEHHRGTVSHYGRLYNRLFFNDGYHVEHHARPTTHWTRLPAARDRTAYAARSAWPATLRWLEYCTLEGLERLALRSRLVQRWLLHTHENAFAALLAQVPEPRSVCIVGGALFPRTAMVLRRLLPGAAITVVDRSSANINAARAQLGDGVDWVEQAFDPGHCTDCDLLVIPLSFTGGSGRSGFYRHPPAPYVLVHDWIWNATGESAVISLVLLKRLNLVRLAVEPASHGNTAGATVNAGTLSAARH